MNKELEELTNTLEKKRLLLVNEDEVDAVETAESGEELCGINFALKVGEKNELLVVLYF